jgi:hypothetical protein
MRSSRALPPVFAAAMLALWCGTAAQAHHSYAMFDLRRAVTVEGTVAKLEWKNPHTFMWVYVKKPGKGGGHDLWGFENGPPGLMQRQGWTRESVKVGEKVVVQYFPLRDGGLGGHLVRLVHADGSELNGDPFAPGVGKELEKGKLGLKPAP